MTPDQQAAPTERSIRLSAVIRTLIQSNPSDRITFADFMGQALYHPDLGYYRQPEDRPTDQGDFLTAPETHPIFGWTVARQIERLWRDLDRPDPFTILEYGAGSGTLALCVLEGFRRHAAATNAVPPDSNFPPPRSVADLLSAVRYTPFESNRHRLAELQLRFEKAGLARRLVLPEPASDGARGVYGIEVVPVTGVLLANEFIDALPVHRVIAHDGEVRELYVSWRQEPWGGRFVEVIGEASTPRLDARLAEEGVTLVEGQVAEICLEVEPWLEEAAARLGRGFAIVIDYGFEAAELYGPRHLAGTLLGYRGHRVVEDPLSDPGDVDLTSHVDFTALRLLGERHGFATRSFATQSEFLMDAGLQEELRALQASSDLTAPDYLRARSGIVRLLDPRHMGRFRVLTLAR